MDEFLSEQDEELKQGLIADTQDMDDIIDQFIDYIRHDSKDKAELGDLNLLVEDVLNVETPTGRSIRFTSNECPKIPLRYVAVKRALANLIQNAIRYSQGDIEVTNSETGNRESIRSKLTGNAINIGKNGDFSQFFNYFLIIIKKPALIAKIASVISL